MDPSRATTDSASTSSVGGRSWPFGWHVRVVEATGSTNVDLAAAATGGAPDHSVLATRHQTAGRGRLDRRWDAPPGSNMLVSMLFRDVPEVPHELTWRVALAAAEACAAVAGIRPVLKWPNDLLVDRRKLAGILAQAGPGYVVVGIGLNVRWSPEGAARLTEAGADVEPLDVLEAMLGALDAQPADIWPVYRAALATLGAEIRVELPGGEDVHGRAIDVGRDGRLIVLDQCGMTRRFEVGDVVHVR
jgi:BirA family biotin operon repressor/biotin-[acetyl-CoA-carboxylase] ligase